MCYVQMEYYQRGDYNCGIIKKSKKLESVLFVLFGKANICNNAPLFFNELHIYNLSCGVPMCSA
jgi:hypothetical protein